MRICILILCLLAIVGGVFCLAGRTDRGTLTTAFGTGRGNDPKGDAYFAGVAAALSRSLTEMGFAAGPAATPSSGMHGGTETTTGYRLQQRTSRPLLVLVTLQTGTASGINVSVWWEFSGFKWNVAKDEGEAQALVQFLGQWWNDYRKAHPEP